MNDTHSKHVFQCGLQEIAELFPVLEVCRCAVIRAVSAVEPWGEEDRHRGGFHEHVGEVVRVAPAREGDGVPNCWVRIVRVVPLAAVELGDAPDGQ